MSAKSSRKVNRKDTFDLFEFVAAFIFALTFTAHGNSLEELVNRYKQLESNAATPTPGYSQPSLSISEGNLPSQDFSNMPLPVDEQSLENSIDDSLYIVGPNDQMQIYLWGTVNTSFRATVDVEGNLLIPSVGVVSVKGQSFAEAKQIIKDAMRKKFSEKQISISLVGLRTFKVYLLGQVHSPRAYAGTSADRATDLITKAGLIPNRSRTRGIILRRKSGDTLVIDLVSFLQTGSTERNPFLQEGDVIEVGAKKEFFSVEGAVAIPGKFDFQMGDQLKDAIRLSGGFARNADTTKIGLFRFADDVDSLIESNVDYAIDSNMPLKPDDRVFVYMKPDYRIHRKVHITGEVQFPGTYPIRRDKTTLQEVIDLTGGTTKDAFLEDVKVKRKDFENSVDLEYERIKTIPHEYLDDLEKSYLKAKLTDIDGNVSADFKSIILGKEGSEPLLLRDNDSIYIPRKNLSVKVMGQVKKPGLVTFRPKSDYNYYITEAGGINTYAWESKIKVIKAGSGIWLNPQEVQSIEPGDTIWIPETIRKDWWKLTQEVVIFTTSIVVLMVNALALSDRI